jgi:hypothetical protein
LEGLIKEVKDGLGDVYDMVVMVMVMVKVRVRLYMKKKILGLEN